MATLTTSYQRIVNQKIGTVSGSGVAAKDLYLRIYAKCSQDIVNNKSTVSYKSTLYATGSGYFYTYNTTTKSLSGTGATSTSASAQGTYYGGQEVTLSEISGTVSHNSSGAASVSMSATWVSTPWDIRGSVSGTASLPTIPRASSITSAGNVTLGKSCNIKWTPANTSFKYKIKFELGSWSHTTGFIEPKQTSAYTYEGYTIPNTSALLDDIPNSTTGTMTATLTTYNSSGTKIGSSSSKSFTVTVPDSVEPTVGTITLNPVNITTADGKSRNILVQGKNKLEIKLSDFNTDTGFKAGTGSGIKSYTFSGPGITKTTTNTTVQTSGTISKSGTLTYTVTVTDNRDRTASATKTIPCYAWSAPSITSFKAYRVASSSSTTADDSGTYIRCEYTVKYSYVNGTNKRDSFSISGGSGSSNITYGSWSTTQTTTTSGVVTASGSAVIKSCPIETTYNISATITDNYGGSCTSNKVTVFSAHRVMNVTKNGTGVAFGKMAGSNNLFESRYKIQAPGLKSSRDGRNNTSLNIASDSEHTACLEYYVAKDDKLTSGSPGVDGHVIHCHWDNLSGHDTQLFLRNGNGQLMSRGCNEGTWGDWRTSLDSVNYTSYVTQKPTTLYSNSLGTNGEITLFHSAADFTYLEIFYMDNNSKQLNSVKVYSPDGKYVTLCCVEPSTANAQPRVYIRTSGWTISGTSMVVGWANPAGKNRGVYAQIYQNAGGTNIDTNITASNYIKIIRVLGYK